VAPSSPSPGNPWGAPANARFYFHSPEDWTTNHLPECRFDKYNATSKLRLSVQEIKSDAFLQDL